jgi:aspartyl-tRNA(Asn)/glutamyl-tRNA(Gln) amidotransferase subunit A
MRLGPTLGELADDLAASRTTSIRLVEECLERAREDSGQGAAAFVSVDADGARRAAAGWDALRAAGAEPTPFAGIPVSIKDLFVVRGQRTGAGSAFFDEGKAEADAAAVAAWRAAGLVVIGRTNMTEFAYSGGGINPQLGTAANPWDRGAHRIPGGSTSGGAISVSDGMAHGALGSDTGGSCRIPAALCGLVGFKPTQARVPRAGMIPLSPSHHAVGAIGRSVSCCATLFALLRGERDLGLPPAARPPRLAVARDYFLDGAEPTVVADFERAVRRLAEAGAECVEIELGGLDQIAAMSAEGGFPAAESYAWHRRLIDAHADEYDPRVLVRIRRGERQTAHGLLELGRVRRQFIATVEEDLRGFDAFVCPTVPIVAPPLAAFDDDEEYSRLNLLLLRNPTVVNLLDGCAVSVPMHERGGAPTGLMLAAPGGSDERVLRAAEWAEERL